MIAPAKNATPCRSGNSLGREQQSSERPEHPDPDEDEDRGGCPLYGRAALHPDQIPEHGADKQQAPP